MTKNEEKRQRQTNDEQQGVPMIKRRVNLHAPDRWTVHPPHIVLCRM